MRAIRTVPTPGFLAGFLAMGVLAVVAAAMLVVLLVRAKTRKGTSQAAAGWWVALLVSAFAIYKSFR